MTTTLVDPSLFCRDFGSQALRVQTLRDWAEERGLTLPPTIPSVADFDLVSLESLLVAFERGVPAMQDDDVLDLAKAIDCDPGMRKLIDKGAVQAARWLVGANIHPQWRKVLEAAIADGELATVDALTGLPQSAPMTAQTSSTSFVHSSKPTTKRRDVLTPIIESAQTKCTKPWDVASVWAQLDAWAAEDKPTPPLIGPHPAGGIQYRGNDGSEVLTRKKLGDRLRRAKPATAR